MVIPLVRQRKREDEERLLERKKIQLDDTKKLSADNNHDTAVDTSDLVAEMMVWSWLSLIATNPHYLISKNPTN